MAVLMRTVLDVADNSGAMFSDYAACISEAERRCQPIQSARASPFPAGS